MPGVERSTAGANTLSVLLVEDSLTDVELIESLLAHERDATFDVTVVGTLLAGLERLARVTPDLVVLDLTLPDSEGLETYRSVRNRAPDVPVVVVTGSKEEGLGQQAVAQGAQDFLLKGTLTGGRLVETILFAVARRARHAGPLRDPLTGFAGAALLAERITEGLGRAERENRYVGLLVAGLAGGLAGIDERFGVDSGAELLFEVANRLNGIFPPSTLLARVGIDEFAVLLEGLARPSNAERAGQRVLGALAADFKLGDDKVRLPGCVGIALGRRAADGDRLLERARAAMLEQRRTGGQGMKLAP